MSNKLDKFIVADSEYIELYLHYYRIVENSFLTTTTDFDEVVDRVVECKKSLDCIPEETADQ